MNIEELKMILETVENTTGAAREIAIAWLVLACIKSLAHFLSVIFVVWFLARTVKAIIFTWHSSTRLARDLGEKHGINVDDEFLGEVSSKRVEDLRKILGL